MLQRHGQVQGAAQVVRQRSGPVHLLGLAGIDGRHTHRGKQGRQRIGHEIGDAAAHVRPLGIGHGPLGWWLEHGLRKRRDRPGLQQPTRLTLDCPFDILRKAKCRLGAPSKICNRSSVLLQKDLAAWRCFNSA